MFGEQEGLNRGLTARLSSSVPDVSCDVILFFSHFKEDERRRDLAVFFTGVSLWPDVSIQKRPGGNGMFFTYF